MPLVCCWAVPVCERRDDKRERRQSEAKIASGAVISEATAIKYFGTTDVLGKTIIKGKDEQFTITGVLATPKGRSHLQLDILLRVTLPPPGHPCADQRPHSSRR